MSTNQNPDQPRPDDSVGDQNIESLLANAYQPELVDPAFAARVRQRAHSESRRKRLADDNRLVTRVRRVWRDHPWQLVATTAVLALLTFTAYRVMRDTDQAPVEVYRDGDYVWVDGQPFHRAASTDSNGERRQLVSAPQVTRTAHRNSAPQIDARGMVPRQRALTTSTKLATGKKLTTGPGQRQHVTLADGSQLYVNENASLTVTGDRKITVDKGEVFVAVAPADTNDQQPNFVVDTPNRDVTAWGTKFAVTVDASGTGVIVTQGKVQVTGIDAMLLAGQQLHPDPVGEGNAAAITPLPRASHVLGWMRELVAATESPLVPRSKYDGGALVAIDPNGQEMKLSLRKYHVDVHIEDGFARTTIDQTYFNHRRARMEGTFYFPLPADASISRLAMYVNGRLMEGGMAERAHARTVFETIKHRALDPALLEWIDGSTFKMRVFPLEGRQEKRIILSYTQKLDNNYGETQYRFPAGHNMDTIRKWSVNAHVVRGADLQWKCASHELTATQQDGDLTLACSASNTRADRDIVITLGAEKNDAAREETAQDTTPQDGAGRASFSDALHESYRYTMVRWRPELPAEAQQQRRDWVFLIDADGSRDPLVARAQIDIVRTLLENAGHEDTFSILTAGTRVRAFAAEQQPVSPDKVAAAVEFLDTTHLIGALDVRTALIAARGFAEATTTPALVHVGSGVPVLGERDTSKLLSELPQDVPYIGVAVGKRWNRNFMKGAAARSGGFFTQINPDESIEWRTLELFSTLNTPRLLDIQVAADPVTADPVTADPVTADPVTADPVTADPVTADPVTADPVTADPVTADPVTAGGEQREFFLIKNSVAHGQELCAIVRRDADSQPISSLTVTARLEGQPWRQTLPVTDVRHEANYLPRIWAKLAIDDMVMRDAEANKAAIIELSKSMYVMSPFTSLLVLENDAMYDQYKVDRGRKDHWALFPCPKKIDVVKEPAEGGQPVDPADDEEAAKAKAKPSPAEVLRTLLIRTRQGKGPLVTYPRAMHNRNFVPANGTVFVPDGGSLFLGGIRRQGIRRQGIPQLGKLPYVNRFFRHDSLGDQAGTQSLMMMVTPRIIIQEEEPLLLGEGFDVGYETFSNRYEFADTSPMADFDSLLGLITSTIEPETWNEVGGRGTIEGFPTHLSLVISQSQSVNKEPERLLTGFQPVADFVMPVTNPAGVNFMLDRHGRFATEFRRFDQLSVPFPDEPLIAYPDVRSWSRLTQQRDKYLHPDLIAPTATADNQVIAKFDTKSSFHYQDVTLDAVVEDFRKRLELPVVLHTEAIKQSGMAVDKKRLTLSLKNITIRAALRLILVKFGLTYYVDQGSLHITTPSDRQQHLALRSRWLDDTLLLFGQATSTPAVQADENVDYTPLVHAWAGGLLPRMGQDGPKPDLTYPALHNGSDPRRFRNLTAFAPGIGTTLADVLAVLEREAELKHSPRTGTIDERAKTLIDAARNRGWQLVTHPHLQVTVDGQGRFHYQRRSQYGLTETVVCDGSTLRHLYPELGLGTTRKLSRFHRQAISQPAPWLLPPVEDLAVGADLRMVGPTTVAIVPHANKDADQVAIEEATREDGKVEAEAESKDDQPQRSLRLHLLFTAEGRLAERQLVEMPQGDIKVRLVFQESGAVQLRDAQNELVREIKLTVTAASKPDLEPNVDDLVVLPMPIRDHRHILKSARMAREEPSEPATEPDALEKIVQDQQQAEQVDPLHWKDAEVLQLVAAYVSQNPAELRSLIGRRFFARGDRRIGFYTLLLSSGDNWSLRTPIQLSDKTTTLMNPVKDHPHSRLANYVQRELESVQQRLADTRSKPPLDENPFIEQLSEYRQLCAEWSSVRELSSDVEVRQRNLDQLFDFIARCDAPRSAYVLLRRLQRRLGTDQPTGRIAAAIIQLEEKGVTSYVVKYELAQTLAAKGQKDQARALLLALYRETLDAGFLPPINKAFIDLIKGSDVNPFSGDKLSTKGIAGLMQVVCGRLVEQQQRPTAIALAWQCRQLGQTQLADRLLDQALSGIDGDQPFTTLAAINYLLLVKRYDRTLKLLEPLLAHTEYSKSAAPWRLAAQIAEDGGRLAQSVRYTETALDLEYENLPQRYNTAAVRQRFEQLFAKYLRLARLTSVVGQAASGEFVSRTIQAADRWRALDSDITPACQQASKLLATLGVDQLAWDYLTTPLALKPNEAAPWLDLAHKLHSDKSYDLASRAFASAFDAERTNAQILWDHARMLEQAGRAAEAQKLYEQIARGRWQPRFQSLQRRAQRMYEARLDAQ